MTTYAPSARETFAHRTAEQNAALAAITLTPPQRRAVHAVATGTPYGNSPALTDSMFSKLDALGLVVADPAALPHRARLSPLGMAYARRAPKGGKK